MIINSTAHTCSGIPSETWQDTTPNVGNQLYKRHDCRAAARSRERISAFCSDGCVTERHIRHRTIQSGRMGSTSVRRRVGTGVTFRVGRRMRPAWLCAPVQSRQLNNTSNFLVKEAGGPDFGPATTPTRARRHVSIQILSQRQSSGARPARYASLQLIRQYDYLRLECFQLVG